MDQGFVLTRSRSDNQIKKSLVWSPTPIREVSVSFLEDLNGCRDFTESSFGTPENPLAIRKFQSAGLLGMEQKLFEKFEESPEPRTVERNLFATEFDDQIFSSSGYSISEIPVRSSNPISHDVKFRESDEEFSKNYLKSDINALGTSNLELFFLAQN